MKHGATVIEKFSESSIHQLRRKLKCESAIFVKLTEKEYYRFQEAQIMYSGATGVGAKPENYNGLAPYIASFVSEIPKALKALRWKRPTVVRQGGSWLIKKAP